MLLGEPARTDWDWNFQLLGIRIRIHPLFWAIAALLGLQSVNQDLVLNEITLFPEQMKVLVHGKELGLTAKEFGLLLYFVSNQNRVISKITLGEFMSSNYADYGFTDDMVYTHIKNLKKKLTASNCKDYIKNVYGVGYKFTVS